MHIANGRVTGTGRTPPPAASSTRADQELVGEGGWLACNGAR